MSQDPFDKYARDKRAAIKDQRTLSSDLKRQAAKDWDKQVRYAQTAHQTISETLKVVNPGTILNHLFRKGFSSNPKFPHSKIVGGIIEVVANTKKRKIEPAPPRTLISIILPLNRRYIKSASWRLTYFHDTHNEYGGGDPDGSYWKETVTDRILTTDITISPITGEIVINNVFEQVNVIPLTQDRFIELLTQMVDKQLART